MGDPGKQGFVTRADLVPVVAGHIGIPIEIALDAPGLVENLAPFFAWIDLDLQSAEIELAVADFGFAGDGVGDAEHRSSLVENFLAFFVEVVAVDALSRTLSSRFSRS